LALALVLAAVFAAAWLLKRLRKIGGGNAGIEVVAQAALGAKERAVLLKVAGAHVLVGVGPGRVNLLHVLGADVQLTARDAISNEPQSATTTPATPSFKALLKQSLGMR
jgi:flagellar protein FliO/FliZ